MSIATVKTLIRPLMAAAFVAVATLVPAAQPTPAEAPDDLRAVLEMLRSDVNAHKIRALNEAMQMTAAEADKFWPVYRQYEKELAAVADRKAALLREFAEHWSRGTLDDQTADRLARQWLKNMESRLRLWSKYHKRIARAVSPVRAAQFLQVEHQMALFIDLNIAAEMPSLGRLTKGARP